MLRGALGYLSSVALSLSLCSVAAIESFLLLMFQEYLSLFLYLAFSLLFILLLVAISVFSVYHNLDSGKNSSYECGFHPFEDARLPFEVRFYLVGVLFIIFDLELIFLFPWVLSFFHLNLSGFCAMFFFLLLLALGL